MNESNAGNIAAGRRNGTPNRPAQNVRHTSDTSSVRNARGPVQRNPAVSRTRKPDAASGRIVRPENGTGAASVPRREGNVSAPSAERRNTAIPAAPTDRVMAETRPTMLQSWIGKFQKRGPIKTTDVVRIRGGIDRPMLIIIILLLCFGSIMVFSASFPYANEKTGDSYYYIKRQVIFALIGMAAMFAASFIDYRFFRFMTVPFFLGVSFLLVLVLVIGVASGKAVRWIDLGPVTFQPSEVMKLGMVLILARYMDKFQDRIRSKNFWYSSFWGDFIPFAMVGAICVLVALEKHFSGTIILFLIGLMVIFAGGARKIWFLIFGGVFGIVILLAIRFVDYAKERLDIFLHPENYDSLVETWQTIQGQIAVGSGGIFGVGFGNSSQKYMYVSQPQNDFIFSIVCEELGLIGAIAVIALFAAFVWRGTIIALRAPDTFSSLVVVGIVGKVAVQSILNMMVVTNMIPNTGITLPFFSYGGTSLMMLLAEMGVVLAISRYTYDEK